MRKKTGKAKDKKKPAIRTAIKKAGDDKLYLVLRPGKNQKVVATIEGPLCRTFAGIAQEHFVSGWEFAKAEYDAQTQTA